MLTVGCAAGSPLSSRATAVEAAGEVIMNTYKSSRKHICIYVLVFFSPPRPSQKPGLSQMVGSFKFVFVWIIGCLYVRRLFHSESSPTYDPLKCLEHLY